MRKAFFVFFIFMAFTHMAYCGDRRAVVVVPVADVLSIGPKTDEDGTSRRYDTLPYSWQQSSSYDECRIHQLLFNQVVNIIKESGSELYVEIYDLYCAPSKGGHINTLKGWVRRCDVMSFDTMDKKGIKYDKIPHFLSNGEFRKMLYITIPCYVEQHGIVYSAGTRFIVSDEGQDSVGAYVFNRSTSAFDIIRFSNKVCVINSPKTKQQKIDLFISLLKSWSNRSDGFIPYVFGGSSWTNTCAVDNVTHHAIKDADGNTIKYHGDICYGYYRNEGVGIRSGFDCSSLIYMAARIADMPYYSKNTTTLARQLRLIGVDEKLEAGDLILMPGHVMVVSGVGNTLRIIQAEGYSDRKKGGKVCEKDAANIFSNIVSSADMMSQYREKKQLVVVNSDSTTTVMSWWKIYKIKSCWNTVQMVKGEGK